MYRVPGRIIRLRLSSIESPSFMVNFVSKRTLIIKMEPNESKGAQIELLYQYS